MEERRLTVYKGRGAFKEAPPQILLQGRWLERAGFNTGENFCESLFHLEKQCNIIEPTKNGIWRQADG